MILLAELWREEVEGAIRYRGSLGKAMLLIIKNPLKDNPDQADLLIYIDHQEEAKEAPAPSDEF